ncbi:MAG: LmbE-like protein [uncultured bacterium]|nr:MAG: LmbE-like protein [uncultured bacterium]HBR79402.1 hypothetical protein [Candidatus Moranbacteria bacterium]
MNEIKSPLNYDHYLFILAHPDDEIYTCVFISELIKLGKKVDIIYITSGDYNGAEVAIERERELENSMKIIGVKKENVHLLQVPERQLMDKDLETRDNLLSLSKQLNPDCVIGHDFEGGHNGHDLVSFFASRVAQELKIPLLVFPAYHGWPENRQWNKFILEKNTDYELNFTDEQKQLQKNVMASHKTQENFMSLILNSADYGLFNSREILRYVSDFIDYKIPPENPLGYEFPGSKIKFEDFKKIIESLG